MTSIQMTLEEARTLAAEGKAIPPGTAFWSDDYKVLYEEGVLGPKRATVARRGTATRPADAEDTLGRLLVEDANRRAVAASRATSADHQHGASNDTASVLVADAERRRILAEKKGRN